jgi:hypothetical protein
MKHATLTAAALIAALATLPSHAADRERGYQNEDCRGYVVAPTSVALSSARAAILASSIFYHPNPLRAHLGPHQYTRLYDPIRACAILRAERRKRRK